MIGKLDRARASALRGSLRSAGRVALWAVVVLLLVHGAIAVVRPAREDAVSANATGSTEADGRKVDAFAVRYARAYLADTSPAAVAELLAPGAAVPAGGGPLPEGMHVAQAEATATRGLGNGRAVVTVWCELLMGRVVYLAVPTVRDQAGGVAALGPPAFVSAPGIGRVEAEAERSQPIPGADAEEIRELASRFVESYLAATDPAELQYLTAPASTIEPLGGFEPTGRPTVRQLGDGAGRTLVVVASVGARVGASTYPVAYRLRLERRDRWYVAAVEGEAR